MTRPKLTKVQRRARMEAVRLAASGGLFVRSTLADGLRAVRLFERINGVTPNPANFHHRMLITNTGWNFALQRRLAALNPSQGSGRDV